MDSKYIFVTGGVVSGLGKGITSATIGALMQARGFKITLLKIDPYVNIDAGTMNPFQHGEVFVTDDGAETDLDLGHYERFTDLRLTRDSNLTTGQIYQAVIERERQGGYLGEDVQLIPHVTDEIKRRIVELGQKTKAQLVIVEIGGTVGDIESEIFLEAIRQFRRDVGIENVAYIHVTKIDYIYPSGETKTKPTQHSVQALQARGIQPDVLVVRCQEPFDQSTREKISIFTDVAEDNILAAQNASSLYSIPLTLERAGLGRRITERLILKTPKPNLTDWQAIDRSLSRSAKTVKIAMVGKYIDHPDAYLSVIEALRHGGLANQVKVEIVPVDSEKVTPSTAGRIFNKIDAIVVPGGFGSRGVEGKITAISYARTHKLPFLGLCLGLQCATIEYCRAVCGLKLAHSSEFEPKTSQPVIDILPEQRQIKAKGATMRLGSYQAVLKKGSLADQLYRKHPTPGVRSRPDGLVVTERHRHRFEVNPVYTQALEQKGFVLSGLSPDRKLVEFVELPRSVHPFFIATQAHPEFKSRPFRPAPLFAGLVKAAKA